MERMLRLLAPLSLLASILLIAVSLIGALAVPARAEIFAQWVEIGPGGTATVRAITDSACPAVIFDGKRAAMRVRSAPDHPFTSVKPASFPVSGCEIAVPKGAKSASLNGESLPLPKPNPQRIVMFGDTGCRLDANRAQACNDPAQWPFPKIAAIAATTRPDLVIHVGDYHYREAACPAGNAGCAGSPFGYGWDVWDADFFKPAQPLFAAAPWFLVRGNHEDCSRAGEGWFRFLDRAPMESACRDLSGIFVAQLGRFALVNVDTAKAENPKDHPETMRDLLRRQFRAVTAKVPGDAWFVTHRPMDAMRTADNGTPTNVVDNSIQEAAFAADMPAGVRMLVAGHIHFFQSVDFGGVYPPQLVVGTGGDVLEPLPPQSLSGTVINGHKVVQSQTFSGFAFMVWDRVGTDWTGTLFDADGKAINYCRLQGRHLSCSV